VALPLQEGRIEWRSAIAAEAFARRILGAAFGTTVLKRRAAIAAEFLAGRVLASAIRTAHRLTNKL
jgi:hypothetical protein